MDIYKDLYFTLFAAIADAVELLERGEAVPARERLIAAMQDAEERLLEDGDEDGEADGETSGDGE